MLARLAFAVFCCRVALTAFAVAAEESDSSKVTVRVNGDAITEGDLEFQYLTRRIPEEQRASFRDKLIDELIDDRLVSAFLDSRKITASERVVDAQVKILHQLIRKGGGDPEELLGMFGYSDETLRAKLSAPVRWRTYVRSVVTGEQLREYWKTHRAEFDGTQLRASHLLIKLAKDAPEPDVQAARKKLAAIREEIVSGKIDFGAAAKKYSEAPSAEKGGDVGLFRYRGKMHPAFADAAFALKDDEISEPMRTPFGMHLIVVTERKPGQLSLEDVRSKVLDRLGQKLRKELVAKEREKAKIERVK
jgi:parvulin-like peptidyl-prolyl isomerase